MAGREVVFCTIFLIFCIQAHVSWAHIPGHYYEWAEPNAAVRAFNLSQSISREVAAQRLSALRAVMQTYGVDAFIVPTADAHNSQYIAPRDARREWISGLSGSSGTGVVTSSQALLWTDGRYFTQFDIQVDADLWDLMRQGTDASIQDWLVSNMAAGSVVGVDPTTYTRSSWTPLYSALASVNVTLSALTDNLVDIARTSIDDPPPARPNNPLITHTVEYSGRVASEKIADLVAEVNTRGASALVLTALDDVAYTLNLRGSDIPYNPVFFAYLVIRVDVSTNNVILFWGDGTLSLETQQFLTSEGVALESRPYEEVFQYLRNYSNDLPFGSTIWLSQDGSEAIHEAAEYGDATSSLSTLSPVALMKCIKNEVELQGFRTAHVKDGVAVVRFMRWIHEQVALGSQVSEMDVSDKLEELRSEEADFMGPSFATIAGAGENGAIIHYKPSREGEQRLVTSQDMLLFDSGGQYRDGTTDITRTRHMGTPTEMQKLTYTRVLKGQILMATAVFPKGSRGNILDPYARRYLFDAGLNYNHGTGHGVGHFLNVHEGPSGIGSAAAASDPGISPGMIFSNEPGYYEVGEYGIRHEDLVEVIEINRDADHIFAASIVGDFDGVGAVGFYTISLAPYQKICLDVDILNDLELKYLNEYHARVLATLGPILLERNLLQDYEFLTEECAPITRSAAILLTATPVLIIVSVLRGFL